MSESAMLLTAVGSLAGCVAFLFGILMAKNKAQDAIALKTSAATDARLVTCETERAELNRRVFDLQKQMADGWKEVALKFMSNSEKE